MCIKYPLTDEEFLNVSGVGDVKAERYGKEFIRAITDYTKKNNIDVQSVKNAEHKNNIETKSVGNHRASTKKSLKEDTYLTTYNLYKQGKSVKEIALKEVSLKIQWKITLLTVQKQDMK